MSMDYKVFWTIPLDIALRSLSQTMTFRWTLIEVVTAMPLSSGAWGEQWELGQMAWDGPLPGDSNY